MSERRQIQDKIADLEAQVRLIEKEIGKLKGEVRTIDRAAGLCGPWVYLGEPIEVTWPIELFR